MPPESLLIDDFDAAVAEGDVVRRDDGELSLYCYSAQCAYDRRWTAITRAARGIVFDRPSGEVVARPFDKFFNLGEVPETAPERLPADGFTVEEKLDGSLGIAFRHDDRWRVVTKGAFGSEQALHAEGHLLPRLRLGSVVADVTLLFEIIYPGNRIVLDYGNREELVLLAVRDRDGAEWAPSAVDEVAREIGASRPIRFQHRNLLDLPFTDQLDLEGYVIRFESSLRVKVKSPRYVQVHRLLEYRSPRRILEMIEAGTLTSIRDEIPDDLAKDFDDVAGALELAILQIEDEARRTFGEIEHLTSDRRSFALEAKRRASPRALPLVFAALDGKATRPLAIRGVRNSLREES